jgi:diguanylate cyclase (GGDEF)-like protein/PAS domain S-box-containing protein
MNAILLPLLLGALLTVGWSVAYIAFGAEMDGWRSRQIEIANSVALTVNAFLQRADDGLAVINRAGRSELAEPEDIRHLLENVPAMLEVVRVDADGAVLGSAYIDRAILASPATIRQSQWFLKARQGERYIGGVQFTAQNEPYLILARPIRDGSVVAGRLRLTALRDIVTNFRFGQGGEVYVTLPDGQIIVHHHPETMIAFTRLPDQPVLARFQTETETFWSDSFLNEAGQAVAVGVAHVPLTNWRVVAELPKSEVHAGSSAALTLLAVEMVLILFGVYVLGRWLIERIFLRPMEAMRAGAEQLGRGQLGFRLALGRADEIGQVAEAFNAMAARLQERDQHIGQQNLMLASEVAERSRAEALVRERTLALQQSEERYALAMRGANDGLWDWDVRANQIYYSPRFTEILGYPPEDFGDTPAAWLTRLHPDDAPRFKAEVDAHLAGQTPHLQSEYRIRHHAGDYRWVLTRGLAVHGASGAYRVSGSLTDISDRKAIEHQLQHAAMHDALTGLPNRAYLMDLLRRALERAKRHSDQIVAVMFIDLDRFKIVNDSLGHASGDQLLTVVGHRLQECMRGGDTVARLGGDEFAVVVEEITRPEDAVQVAQRLQSVLSAPVTLAGREVFTTASIGIALSMTTGDAPDDLLKKADLAMYAAKNNGKARHSVFDTATQTRTLDKLQLEVDFRGALDHDEFVLHYQPIVSLLTGEMTGMEALVRWQHPGRGLLGPGEFVPMAEETGLIVPLGAWVLRAACVQLSRWHAEGHTHLRVAVNVSAHQLRTPTFVEHLRTVLAETHLPPHAVELEITESAAMQDVEQTLAVLRTLRELGVYIAIDDFGNSYSALGYLKHLPANTLKIDRSFVSNIAHDRNDAAITSAMIAMAGVLNMNVVAEGVETQNQLNTLIAYNCGEVQGFLASRPLPAEALSERLKTGAFLLPGIERPPATPQV